ncbi:MAG: hypothetical protein F6J92_08410 [Symploca sp. SIO1A3]|nr:hypothetical protein [Symploca sp. SIO1A3]
MFREQHLQEKLAELQEDYKFHNKRVKSLKKSLRIDDFTPQKEIKLKMQIEEAKTQREEAAQQIEELNKQIEGLNKIIGSEQLYRVLLKLGYNDQVGLFLKLVNNQSVSAFLIHGASEYGQDWLLNRLVGEYVPHIISGKKVNINLERKVRSTDVSALWRELGGRFNLCVKDIEDKTIQEIADRVYRCWQTQNVLFVFHNVECMPQVYLEELIIEFWKPLTEKARNSSASKFQLLMFLVDYKGSVGSLDTLFSDQINSTKPYPIKPPEISKFDKETLSIWLQMNFVELPIKLKEQNPEDTAIAILEESKGIPEPVMTEIFNRCGFNYYEETDRQWKL